MIDRGHLLDVVQGCEIRQFADNRIIQTADADIDADGANGQSDQWAYKVGNKGLEDLANAGYPDTNWYRDILLCDEDGHPVILPGGGIPSKTTYEWKKLPKNDPNRWVDSFGVPYAVAGSTVRRLCNGILVGCRCRMTNIITGASCEGGVLDIGPARKIGEISIAAAKKLGLPWNPRNGGTSGWNIRYEFFPGIPAVINGVTYDLLRA